MSQRFVHLRPEENAHYASHTICQTCSPHTTRFCSNYISTTKYNLLTFVPLNLFEQFRKKANFYFLIVAIVSCTPLSPKTPFVSVAPLVFVLSVSAIKEAVEDWARYKMDKEINGTLVKTWREDRYVDVCWKDVGVGDVVYLEADCAFPADIILLQSSQPLGVCTIETSNLDGETNLKVKQAVAETYHLKAPDDTHGLEFLNELGACYVASSAPSKLLVGDSAWTGNLTLASKPKEPISLGMDQLLLRGCTMRNTKWIVGLVMFTGEETKLMLNSRTIAFKRSNVDRIVDKCLYILFTLQFCLCCFGALMNYLWVDLIGIKHWYLPYAWDGSNLTEESVLSWFTYLVLLDILIPISLYVSMELVKFLQAWYINRDIDMYYPLTNTPARARTSNLNEELGQVSYVFSDKTGTLTGNIMNFLCCSVNGVVYGDPVGDDFKRLKEGPLSPSSAAAVASSSSSSSSSSDAADKQPFRLGSNQRKPQYNTFRSSSSSANSSDDEGGGGGDNSDNDRDPMQKLTRRARSRRKAATADYQALAGNEADPAHSHNDGDGDGDNDGDDDGKQSSSSATRIKLVHTAAAGSALTTPLLRAEQTTTVATSASAASAGVYPSLSINRDSVSGTPAPAISNEEMPINEAPVDVRGVHFAVPTAKGIPPPDEKFPFRDSRLLQHLTDPDNKGKQILNEFLTLLATCHTVIPEFPGCVLDHMHGAFGVRCQEAVDYQASSPDEKALTIAAKNCQYYFFNRHPKTIVLGGRDGIPALEVNGEALFINILGTQWEFEIIEIFKFDSARARMSVIVRDPRDRKLKLYCKGSDAKLYNLIARSSRETAWPVTDQHLTVFAKLGLRTLVCAYRELDEALFVPWMTKHKVAKAAVDNREKLVAASENQIDRDFTLLGTTAIEDKLQDGVPGTISKLLQAGIRVWVLTGDKFETAVNISRSCRLITPLMEPNLIRMNVKEKDTDEEAKRQTFKLLTEAWEHVKDKPDGSADQGIVVSGRALSFIFPAKAKGAGASQLFGIKGYVAQWWQQFKSDIQNFRLRKPNPAETAESDLEERIKMLFLRVCTKCQAVVCCRVSPNQKAEVVQLVKDRVPCITLAIGDGANDVSMIKAAHVGIGISGLEGLQAVMASDYAIAQFRFLENLLLVHGAWSYRRTSLLILYSFYKNVAIAMTQVWFAFFCGFSAQMYYDPYEGSVYNMFFTAFPVLLVAVLNRDVGKAHLLRYPQLYRSGQHNEFFNPKLLFLNIFEGLAHSLILYFTSLAIFGISPEPDGTTNDLWTISSAMYSFLIVAVNLRIALDTTTWTWVNWVAVIVSVGSWFWVSIVYCSTWLTPDMWGVAQRMFELPHFWFALLLVPVMCIVPELAFRYVKRMYFPSLLDIIAELERGYGNSNSKQPIVLPT